ncbi:MAG: hypothetical protein HQM13_03365 [SAR324 cluster bacterium]|nr:hypothetical protein [SAR324 cluster bacterium]
MDNLISGIISALVFIAFVGGLAESIGAIPFIIIVVIVIIMMLVVLVESVKEGFRGEKIRREKNR